MRANGLPANLTLHESVALARRALRDAQMIGCQSSLTNSQPCGTVLVGFARYTGGAPR